jgi:hypothetical protein
MRHRTKRVANTSRRIACAGELRPRPIRPKVNHTHKGLASLTALLFQRRAVALIMSNIARRQMTNGAKAFKAEADAGIARHRVAGRKSG